MKNKIDFATGLRSAIRVVGTLACAVVSYRNRGIMLLNPKSAGIGACIGLIAGLGFTKQGSWSHVRDELNWTVFGSVTEELIGDNASGRVRSLAFKTQAISIETINALLHHFYTNGIMALEDKCPTLTAGLLAFRAAYGLMEIVEEAVCLYENEEPLTETP